MQNSSDRYTFLFTNSSCSKIHNNRPKLLKKFLHTFAVALNFSIGIISAALVGFILFIGIVSASSAGILKLDSFYLPKVSAHVQSESQAIDQKTSFSPQKTKSFNYERPSGTSARFAASSGGPEDSFQLSGAGSESEENEIEMQMRTIEMTTNPESLPMIWAHMGKINNEFGYRRNPFGGRSYEFHSGLDIDGNRGDIVVAPANGVVIKAGWQGGYGNLIEVDHGNGLTTRYGHLSQIQVRAGDTLARGQLIGLVGSTGRSTGPHLHFELRLNDKPINPRRLLPPEAPEIRALNANN